MCATHRKHSGSNLCGSEAKWFKPKENIPEAKKEKSSWFKSLFCN